MWIYGTADPNFSGPSCHYTNDCLGHGFSDSNNRWQFGDEQLASTVFGSNALGCSTTPTVTIFGKTNRLTRRVYAPCRAGSRIATETIEASGAGHIPEGFDGLDIAAESWRFFTNYG